MRRKKIKFGTGAIPTPHDPREVAFGAIIIEAPVVDWEIGFDVEDEIGKLEVNNQGQSLSCVGQAWSKYGEVLDRYDRRNLLSVSQPNPISPEMIYPKVRLSPRFIYSQIYLPQGGAYGYKGGAIFINQGDAEETFVPSYQNGQLPTEDFMRIKESSQEITMDAAQFKGSGYASVNTNNIDEVAYAILKNKGMVGGTYLDNNTYKTAFLQLPKSKDDAHYLCFKGFKIIDGKKHIRILNSWGETWGENGRGYLGEEWFDSSCLFNAYTLMDIPNNWKQVTQMLKLIQLQGNVDQYIVVGNTRYAIPDWETKVLLRDKLQIILDEPQIVSQQDFAVFLDGGRLPSVIVCNAIKGILPILLDAFEPNK